MMKTYLFTLLALIAPLLSAEAQTRIIDMHVHSYSESEIREMNNPTAHYGTPGSSSAEELKLETYKELKKWNIVKAVVSGSPESVEEWALFDTSERIIRGLLIFHPDDYGLDSLKFEQMVINKEIQVFGEIGAYYSGTTLSDEIWQPYLRICEKYDIPVAVHTGGGDPGGTYSWSPNARLRLGDPYLIEDVLVNYPKLRIYMMHAGGEDWPEHAIRLMAYYPQLYTDLGVMLWVEPNTQRYITEFLKNIKHAGYLDRVMFGSDQMTWPYAIGKSIDFLNSLEFLTEEEKEGIFYSNATRFLKMEE